LGGHERSAGGGKSPEAGAAGNSHTAGGTSGVAGSDVTQAGAPAGSDGGAADGGGRGGVAGAGGVGEDPNKVVLFDGSQQSFDSWYPRNSGMKAANPWTNNGDGTMTVNYGAGSSDIISKVSFRDVFVHLEYFSQKYDYRPGTYFQGRGASGVFLNGSYKLVILDTFGQSPEPGQEEGYCGAIHYVSAPLVSACKPGGEWNAYDIEFRAEVCSNGVKTTNAEFVEVWLNGTLVQQHVEVERPTQGGLDETCEPRGVLLQELTTLVPVSFRNIWAIPRN